MKLPRPASREERFWRWFVANERRLFRFEQAQDEVFGDLSRALKRLHRSLCFEFGPVDGGRREFIISAQGDKQAFPQVQALARAAPALENWIVIPFRPPKNLKQYSYLRYGDVTLHVDDIWFSYEQVGDRVDLTLYIRGLTPASAKDLGAASFILLDAALGEFVVETRVGAIERKALPPDPLLLGLLPFPELLVVVGLSTHWAARCRLTTRCSGLASLAAELGIVRLLELRNCHPRGAVQAPRRCLCFVDVHRSGVSVNQNDERVALAPASVSRLGSNLVSHVVLDRTAVRHHRPCLEAAMAVRAAPRQVGHGQSRAAARH